MARKATGQVIEPKDGRGWAIRFRAYGKRRYLALGTTEEGWSYERAEEKLRHVLADVERGIWRPLESEPVEAPIEVPTFHQFASEWFEEAEAGWRERTRVDYRWRLSDHLLPYFAKYRLNAITIEEVDRYRRGKVREAKALQAAREAQLALPEDKRKRGCPERRRTSTAIAHLTITP